MSVVLQDSAYQGVGQVLKYHQLRWWVPDTAPAKRRLDN